MWKSKFYGAFVLNHRVILHVIDATPAAPDTLVDFHTGDGYGVEAAVGGFPDGGFLRLSHAVYTSDDDVERLRDAVLELV